ncbi:MAG: hypothetical protein ABI082_09445 [Dokdonella sp.]
MLASMTAARSVHVPAAVWHAPFPGLSSTASAVLFTVIKTAVAKTCGANISAAAKHAPYATAAELK